MSKKQKLEIDQLEERIAPSSLNLGSLADNVLSGANASGLGSGDTAASGNDPSIANNAVNAVQNDVASIGAITGAVRG